MCIYILYFIYTFSVSVNVLIFCPIGIFGRWYFIFWTIFLDYRYVLSKKKKFYWKQTTMVCRFCFCWFFIFFLVTTREKKQPIRSKSLFFNATIYRNILTINYSITCIYLSHFKPRTVVCPGCEIYPALLINISNLTRT